MAASLIPLFLWFSLLLKHFMYFPPESPLVQRFADFMNAVLWCCNMHDGSQAVFAPLLSGILHIEVIVKLQLD